MTSALKPLEVVINKRFKDYIRIRNIKYYYEKNNLETLSRDLIINWISEVWWDNNLITPFMIQNSFKVTGLINKIDRSENDLFTGFKKIRKEIIIRDDEMEKMK